MNKTPLFRICLYCLITFIIFIPDVNAALFERSCPTLGDFIAEGSGGNCILCFLYEIIFNMCKTIIDGTWNFFASSLQAVIAIGTAIYVAVFTLKNIGNFSQQDTGAYLSNDKTGILPIMLKGAIVIVLLSDDGYTFLYGYLIAPVITDGIDIGSQLASGGNGLGVSSVTGVKGVSSLFDAIIDKIEEFNDNVYTIIAMGRMLWCLIFLPDSIFNAHWGLLLISATLYIMGWIVLIGVSFFLLDVVFRLAIACILLPFSIACGMSKLTSSYTKKNWNLFVNVFFSFVVVGILVLLTTEMIVASLSANEELQDKLKGTVPLNNSDVEDIMENLNAFAILLGSIACTLSFKLFLEIEPLVDKLSSSKSVGGGKDKDGNAKGLGGAIAKPVTATALAPAKAYKGLVTGMAKGTARELGKDIMNSSPIQAARLVMRDIGEIPDKIEKKLFGTSKYD